MAMILTRSEKKKIGKYLEERFGIKKFNLPLARTGKDRIWIIPRDISRIYLKDLRIEFVGVYFGSQDREDYRLSIEACQLLGNQAKKNLYLLNKKELDLWLTGKEIPVEREFSPGYILLKYKDDFVGSARYSSGRIINMLQKSRRLKE